MSPKATVAGAVGRAGLERRATSPHPACREASSTPLSGRTGTGGNFGLGAESRVWRIQLVENPFLWAMQRLPAPRVRALHALHAFCREVETIAHSGASSALKQAILCGWRGEIALLYEGRPRHALARSLIEPVRLYGLRCSDFLAIIDGWETDTRLGSEAPSLPELDLHCVRTTGSIGRLAMQILGLETPAAEHIAAELGRAVRLTELLRDLSRDATHDRIYLPRELLRRHGLPANSPRSVLTHPALANVCCELAMLAEEHYAAAAKAIAACRSPGARIAALILATYRAILQEVRASGWKRPERPIRLSAWRKAGLALGYALASAKSLGI